MQRRDGGEPITINVIDKLTYASNINRLQAFIDRESIELHIVDIASSNDLAAVFGTPDVVVNFAAESHVDNSIKNPAPFITSNVLGTLNLLELCKRNGCKFIQVSTDEVYGSISGSPASEDYPLLPNSPYAASKASADLVVRSFVETFNLEAVITRCTNNYGPGQHQEKFIPKTIRSLTSGSAVEIYGDGLNVREWVSVKDHVDGISLAIVKGQAGHVYNLGSGERLTNLEVVSMLAKALSIDSPKLSMVEDRLGHDRRYAVSSDKAKSDLGFSPSRSLSTEMANLISGYL